MPRILGDLTKRKRVIDRAALVGGGELALALSQWLNDAASMRRANDSANTSASIANHFTMVVPGLMSPFQRCKRREAKTERLVEEAFVNCFYMILSALDYKSVAEKQPLILWRTKLSVNSDESLWPKPSGPGSWRERSFSDGKPMAESLFPNASRGVGA